MKNFIDYHSYMKSEEWNEVKRKTFLWSGCCCYRCKATPQDSILDCHHLTYKNLGNEVPGRDTITLCRKCHELIHFSKHHITPQEWARIKEEERKNKNENDT